MKPEGTHILVDLFEAADPGDRAEDLLRKAAGKADCRVLEVVRHVFAGGGRTVLALLSKSHASIHTWPEARYIAFDLFSCARLDSLVVDEVVDLVKEYIPAERSVIEVRTRGCDLPA